MHLIPFLTSLGALAAVALAYPSGSDKDKNKDNTIVSAPLVDRPVSIAWPQSRPPGNGKDSTAPCGTGTVPSDRAEFPLSGGKIAVLMGKEKVDNVMVKIAYSDSPTSNSDFEAFPDSSNATTAFQPGRQCISIPDLSSKAKPGSRATIQLSYTVANPDGGAPVQQYSCADVRFLKPADFKGVVSCKAEDGPTELESGKVKIKKEKKLSNPTIVLIVFALVIFAGLMFAVWLQWRNKK